MFRMPGYHTELNETDDLKDSVDLNTRVLLELLQTSNEQLRLQSAQTIVTGSFSIQGGAVRMQQKEALEW